LADVASVPAEPDVYGQAASDPLISRLLTLLASAVDTAERAINTARPRAREAAWTRAGGHAPHRRVTATHPLIIDLDATLVKEHRGREGALATYNKGFGCSLLAFAGHVPDGGGEMLSCLLRPDNAGSNTAAGHKDQTGADPGGDGSSSWEEVADPERRC